MRRLFITAAIVLAGCSVFAQTDSTRKAPAVSLPRSNDHFLIQIGRESWQGKPDSIQTGGFPRTFNMYFMLDYPFKTNAHWSSAIGVGIATDNMFFKKTRIGINENVARVPFQDVSDTNHFKKYKLATAYLEAPIELRWRSNPDYDGKSLKVALGAKVGVLVNAHTKGKKLENKSGTTLGDFTEKINSKNFFNKNRISVTGRVGLGHFSIFTSYALTPLFKEGVASTIRPLTIGLTISGL